LGELHPSNLAKAFAIEYAGASLCCDQDVPPSMLLLPLLQVASIVESGVASAAPAIGANLQEAGELLSKAGQEAAGQLQVGTCGCSQLVQIFLCHWWSTACAFYGRLLSC
jgi:hypothetical protein